MTHFQSRNKLTSEIGRGGADTFRPTPTHIPLLLCGKTYLPHSLQNLPKSRLGSVAHGSICIQKGQPDSEITEPQ